MSAYHGWTHVPKALGGTDPTRIGLFEIIITAKFDPVVSGDDAGTMFIPDDLNGTRLYRVAAFVTNPSSSGLPTVQIRNVTQAQDFLTTKCTIDAGETSSYTAATPAVINAATSLVAQGDEIAIDVDVAGTGAEGLVVALGYG